MSTDLTRFGLDLSPVPGGTAAASGRAWLEDVCRPIASPVVRSLLHGLIWSFAVGRVTASSLAHWRRVIHPLAHPNVLPSLLLLPWVIVIGAKQAPAVWIVAPAVGTAVLLSAIFADLMLQHAQAGLSTTTEAGHALYLDLQCAWYARPGQRAAWWRRLRMTLGAEHGVLGYLLDAHASDGGIPGLTVEEIHPLLASDERVARLAAITALAEATRPMGVTASASTAVSRTTQ